MTTGTKILIGAGIVAAGLVIYKVSSTPAPVLNRAPVNTSATGVNGFLDLASSVANYFKTASPAPRYTNTTGALDTGIPWSSGTQVNPSSDFSNIPYVPDGATDAQRDALILG